MCRPGTNYSLAIGLCRGCSRNFRQIENAFTGQCRFIGSIFSVLLRLDIFVEH